jgi:hypothetical protein
MTQYIQLELNKGTNTQGKRIISEEQVMKRRIPGIKIIDDYYYENGGKVEVKTKDDLYYFMADNFADYLQELYDKQCS